VQEQRASSLDWRDGDAYAPLLDADRSLFAWEWLRRDPGYRALFDRAATSANGERLQQQLVDRFGLLAFERPGISVPDVRPLWASPVHPAVLEVEPIAGDRRQDRFDLGRLGCLATILVGIERDHLLLSDGLRMIRLDGPPGTFGTGPVCFRYGLQGLHSAAPGLLTLRRFLALCSRGRFARTLHPREQRARRWILLLRAHDALASGASQREIAEVLLKRSAAEPRWRLRDPSLRSQSQRLVRAVRAAAGQRNGLLLAERYLRP
jgi:hypothetical protein